MPNNPRWEGWAGGVDNHWGYEGRGVGEVSRRLNAFEILRTKKLKVNKSQGNPQRSFRYNKSRSVREGTTWGSTCPPENLIVAFQS